MVDEVTPRQAYDAVLAGPDAVLVDVRTEGEWQHIGVPVVEDAGKRPVLVSWQYPTGAVNPNFLAELGAAGVSRGQTIYFLCRSGVRSLSAALAAEAAGFARCFNVAGGFEGAHGMLAGWQAEGLPWRK